MDVIPSKRETVLTLSNIKKIKAVEKNRLICEICQKGEIINTNYFDL